MNESKATRYQRLRRRSAAAALASGGVVLALLAVTPLSGALAAWADGAGGGSSVLSLVLFVGAIVAAWLLAVLPARVLLGARAGRYAGAPTGADGIVAAELQWAVIVLTAAVLAAAVVRAAVAVAPGWWWAVAGAALAAVLAAALRGLPVAFARFAAAEPLAREGLAARLAELAARAGVPVASIDAIGPGGPTGATAFVAGVGRTRRVFVAADVLRDWSDDEIAVVVAHELGHHARHDLWRAGALSAATLTAALWSANAVLTRLGPTLQLGSAADLRAWPLLFVVAGAVWMVTAPLRHGQSRRHERKADEFALALTGETDAFAAAIRRLGARHLAEEQPTTLTRWLFHRHPPVAERLALADRFRTS